MADIGNVVGLKCPNCGASLDEANKELATVLASGMKRSKAAEIEQQAEAWLQQHPGFGKPTASR